MSAASIPLPMQHEKPPLPIVVGGAVAGTLDMTSAFITFGAKMPLGIAAGLIGVQAARHGGAATWVLGLVLHFFIAFSAATVYCLASRKLPFLKDHFVVCGLFYGIGFFQVMTFIVLPLCAFHAMGPYTWRGLVQGLLAQMFLIGLPISFALRKLS